MEGDEVGVGAARPESEDDGCSENENPQEGLGAREEGHPLRARGEDCIGISTSELVKHVIIDKRRPIDGDIYCVQRWFPFFEVHSVSRDVFAIPLQNPLAN